MAEFNEFIMNFVWPVTFITAAISILIFFTLIILRFFKDYASAKRAIRKKEIRQQLLVHIANPLKNLKKDIVNTENDMSIIAEIAPDLLRVLKGTSYDDLLKSFEEIGFYDWILKKIKGRNKADKFKSISLIANWSNNQVKQELIALLNDKNILVQYTAIEALAHTRDVSLFPKIIEILKKQKGFSTLLICNVFQKFNSNISKMLIEQIEDKDIPIYIKIPAFMTLIKNGAPEQITKIAMSLYNHENNELRALAYLGLSESRETVPKEILQAGFKDDDWRVRQYVTRCAAHSTPPPVEMLGHLLNDENWFVGFSSGKELYDLGSIGQKFLETIANQKDGIASHRAASILAEYNSKNYGGAYGMA
ncbi:MAG: hypothetical protein AB7U85_10350 [Alphaproteobacteria bacterium]